MSLAGVRLAGGVTLSICSRRPQGRSFVPRRAWAYRPFCDDFGPPDLYALVSFIREVDRQISACIEAKQTALGYCVGSDRRDVSNAVFLVGGFMILMMNVLPERVFDSFATLDLAEYRDVLDRRATFGLSVLDCWRGLHRAKLLGWIRRPADLRDSVWGRMHMGAYVYWSDPHNADLHEVVPGRLIAFRGPCDVPGNFEDIGDWRFFSPSFMASLFRRDLDVSAVVQLGGEAYDVAPFEHANIRHFTMAFEDCAAPPREVVVEFFRVMQAVRGCVAVHCLAGLGRTGTLIALWLMATHRFSAREALGWLRIVRPGSVIGEQQEFLCRVEQQMAASAVPKSTGIKWAAWAGAVACAAVLAVLCL